MKKVSLIVIFYVLVLLQFSCKVEDPEAENESEIITEVTLTFTSSSETLTFTAVDPDGEGPQELETSGPITLAPFTKYDLSISFKDGINNEDITAEIEEEADEHVILFGFTAGLFTLPNGTGNIEFKDNSDRVLYKDSDSKGFDLGLETEWETGEVKSGSFRIVLKHQPEIKTATSGINEGETDVDITWNLDIQYN